MTMYNVHKTVQKSTDIKKGYLSIRNNVNTFGRGNCKEAIFALENGISRHKNQHRARRTRRRARFFARGLRPSRALQGFLTV